MKNPLVSTVIPTKNEERYIGRCLDSLERQTYSENEIIVVDSNSTDKTKDIAKRRGVDKLINKNCIMPAARNEGVSQSSKDSKYVCMLDADTILEPPWLENGINYLEKNYEAVAVYGDFKPFENQGLKGSTAYCFSRIGQMFLRIIRKANISTLGTGAIIRKKAFEEIGGYTREFTPCEDIDISIRLSRIGKTKQLKEMKGYSSMRAFEKFGLIRRFLQWGKDSIPYLFLNKKPYHEYAR